MISTGKGSNPFTPKINKYYNKLIVKKKLLNFWTFSGIELKKIFLFNYKFIFCFYKKRNTFFEYNTCISIIKKIFPLFHSIVNNQANILFIGSHSFYMQSFFFGESNYISKLMEEKLGSFTNFFIEGFNFFKNKKLKKNASIIFFFSFSNDFLILESNKKRIPSIGLINVNNSISLLDYPIFLNSFYFYNVYFFSRLIFKYILRLL